MRSALSALVDVLFVSIVVVGLTAGVVALFSPSANDAVARFYGRHMGLTEQAACPRYLGNNFWFACAGEVRRRHPPPAVIAKGGQPTSNSDLHSLHSTK